MKRFLFPIVALCLAPSSIEAEPIQLVKDIETEGVPFYVPSPFPVVIPVYGGYPFGLTAIGDRIVFYASDRILGFEPWVSDGTEAGTFRIDDTCAGDCGVDFDFAYATEGLSYFFSEGGLWSTDGTAQGTVQRTPDGVFAAPGRGVGRIQGEDLAMLFYPTIRDKVLARLNGPEQPPTTIHTFCQDPGTSFCSTYFHQRGEQLFLGENTYFGGGNPQQWRFWSSDGTSEGTLPLLEFSCRYEYQFFSTELANGQVFLTAKCGGVSGAIWGPLVITDGTSEGTEFLADASQALTHFLSTEPVAFGNDVYLSTEDHHLWRLREGQAEVVATFSGPIFRAETVGERIILFVGPPAARTELWAFDPAADTAERLHADLSPELFLRGRTNKPAQWRDVLFFAGYSTAAGTELAMTDGTPRGTRIVEDLVPGEGHSLPSYFTVAGDRLFFAAETPELDRELFTLDLEEFLCPSVGGLFPSSVPCSTRQTDIPSREEGDAAEQLESGSRGFVLGVGNESLGTN